MRRAATRAPDRYRFDDPERFRLQHIDPADTGSFRSKEHAQKELEAGTAQLSEFQDELYAQDRWGAAGLPGDGRGRQGQHHQARHERSAGAFKGEHRSRR